MKDTTSYFHILDQISEIASRITQLVGEQRLATEQFHAGTGGADILEKDRRLQAEIAHLDEQRERLLQEAQIIFGKN